MIFVRQIFLGDHHIDNCHCNISSNVYSASDLDTPKNGDHFGQKLEGKMSKSFNVKSLFIFLALYLFREKVLQSKHFFGFWFVMHQRQLATFFVVYNVRISNHF